MVLGQGSEALEIYSLDKAHAEPDDMLILYGAVAKTLFFADVYNGGFIGLPDAFPYLGMAATVKKRAQFLVDFVE